MYGWGEVWLEMYAGLYGSVGGLRGSMGKHRVRCSRHERWAGYGRLMVVVVGELFDIMEREWQFVGVQIGLVLVVFYQFLWAEFCWVEIIGLSFCGTMDPASGTGPIRSVTAR